MNHLPTVASMLETLQSGIQQLLRSNLVGVYLRGSLALGDFIPATSDIDLLVVTAEPVGAAEFTALAAMHTSHGALPNPYANRIEMAYIDRIALRRFTPGLHHATLGQGEQLAWSEHRDNWIVERWTVREHGVVLLGPHPKSLIDPVSADELLAAVRTRLHDWADWANQLDDPGWQLPRSHKAYVVETMCRARYTLAWGSIVSKPNAVRWALDTLPEPWRGTVERSQLWRTDATYDLAIVPEVRRFVLWAATADRAS